VWYEIIHQGHSDGKVSKDEFLAKANDVLFQNQQAAGAGAQGAPPECKQQ
jgi:hypothetical protein